MPETRISRRARVVWARLGCAFLTILGAVVLGLLRAAVLMALWHWYAVPGFGVAPIGLPVAFGVTLMALWLQRYPLPRSDDPKPSLSRTARYNVTLSLFVLLIGWIGSLFV